MNNTKHENNDTEVTTKVFDRSSLVSLVDLKAL